VADHDAAPKRSLAQSVFRDGALYAVAGALGQAIGFILFPFLAHVFEPSDFGVVDLVVVITTIVNLTVALEVSQGLGRHFADAPTFAAKRAYASSAFTFSLLCYTGFCTLVVLLAAPLTDLLLGDDVDPGVMRVAAAAMFFNGLSYMAMDLLRWQLRPRAFALATVGMMVGLTSSTAIYVLVLDWGVEGAIAGQVTGYIVGGTIAFTASRHLFRLHIDRARLHEMLAYSLPLVPASTGVFFNGYADRLAIQARMTLGDVGLYGVGYRLSTIVGLTLIGFQGAMMPQILARHHEVDTPISLARVFRLFCALALTVWIAISTFGDEIIRVLTTPAYDGADAVVPYVVAAAFFAGMYIFAPGLNIAKRTKVFASIAVSCGLLNLVLAFVLVGPLGIEGAALSFLLTQMIAFGSYMHFSQRIYPAPHEWRRLGIAAAVATGLTVLGWRLPPVDEHLWGLPAKLAVVALGVVFLAYWLTDGDERAMGRRVLAARLRRRAAEAPLTATEA